MVMEQAMYEGSMHAHLTCVLRSKQPRARFLVLLSTPVTERTMIIVLIKAGLPLGRSVKATWKNGRDSPASCSYAMALPRLA